MLQMGQRYTTFGREETGCFHVDWDVSSAKGGYEHFMMKEICENQMHLKPP